ncbi:hypothetical protein M409DRAFT_48633 [Zasmidium cellare ATCC 36951]|uniref:Uncharacterized protein n=1 Tax=Zasmidium cellare ATCC 36951 TaxID=1080233 RepID=A0A6A6D2S3_ZASCE|nr:uncharacterized protein M409DRAFT_48633 [Zasmidium cellare ATCC 36951]KAF2173694.1 hypothetical protein M409DRAFT_48633 [Zasmidium cellare ATCC 36951]
MVIHEEATASRDFLFKLEIAISPTCHPQLTRTGAIPLYMLLMCQARHGGQVTACIYEDRRHCIAHHNMHWRYSYGIIQIKSHQGSSEYADNSSQLHAAGPVSRGQIHIAPVVIDLGSSNQSEQACVSRVGAVAVGRHESCDGRSPLVLDLQWRWIIGLLPDMFAA